MELFKQPAYSPKPVEVQVALLWAMQNDHFDDVEVDDIVSAANSLEDFLSTGKQDLLAKILEKKQLDEEIETSLTEAVSAWKSTYKSA